MDHRRHEAGGAPFQKLADVPEDVWRNIRLDDYFSNGASDAAPQATSDVQPAMT